MQDSDKTNQKRKIKNNKNYYEKSDSLGSAIDFSSNKNISSK